MSRNDDKNEPENDLPEMTESLGKAGEKRKGVSLFEKIDALEGRIDDTQKVVTGLKDVTLAILKDQELVKKDQELMKELIIKNDKRIELMEERLLNSEIQLADSRAMHLKIYQYLSDLRK